MQLNTVRLRRGMIGWVSGYHFCDYFWLVDPRESHRSSRKPIKSIKRRVALHSSVDFSPHSTVALSPWYTYLLVPYVDGWERCLETSLHSSTAAAILVLDVNEYECLPNWSRSYLVWLELLYEYEHCIRYAVFSIFKLIITRPSIQNISTPAMNTLV